MSEPSLLNVDSTLYAYMMKRHQYLRALFGRLIEAMQANAGADVRSLWNELEHGLLSHMEAEERFVLPRFAHVDGEEARALLREHGLIRESLLELGVAVDLHCIRYERSQDFVDLLFRHAVPLGRRPPRAQRRAGREGAHRGLMRHGPTAGASVPHLWYKRPMTLFDLAGKVAVVTGSTKGIGKAIAERLAEHGARVVVSSRKADACNEVAAGINAARGAQVAVPIACNINYKEQLHALVDETHAKLGPIDVLVCNAAVNPAYGSMSQIKDEAFDKILGANIRSNHWLAQMVLPDMIAKRDGAIILVSSIGGYRGSTMLGTYCISKAADLQLARNLAVEYGPHNIRVNCIAPGLVKTDFARALWDSDEGERRASSATPLRRLGDPDDIAGAAVFLASRAGAWMTGQSIIVDGGALA